MCQFCPFMDIEHPFPSLLTLREPGPSAGAPINQDMELGRAPFKADAECSQVRRQLLFIRSIGSQPGWHHESDGARCAPKTKIRYQQSVFPGIQLAVFHADIMWLPAADSVTRADSSESQAHFRTCGIDTWLQGISRLTA